MYLYFVMSEGNCRFKMLVFLFLFCTCVWILYRFCVQFEIVLLICFFFPLKVDVWEVNMILLCILFYFLYRLHIGMGDEQDSVFILLEFQGIKLYTGLTTQLLILLAACKRCIWD